MYKKVNVVMLSTNEKATNIVKILKDTISYTTSKNISGGTYQHLYITSDDEIKEGDWLIHDVTKLVIQDKTGDNNWGNSKKIIATTDNNLFSKDDIIPYTSLPQIHQSFIEHYVNEYNKGNVITKVMVEFEKAFSQTNCSNCNGTGYLETEDFMKPRCYYCNRNVGTIKEITTPKLNQDNTINIKNVKDSWSREEVVTLLNKLNEQINIVNKVEFENEITLEQWIEENL